MKAPRDKAQLPSHATAWHPPGNRDVAAVTFFIGDIALIAAVTSSGQHRQRCRNSAQSQGPRATGKPNADADAIVAGDWKVFRCSSPPVITDHDPSEPPCPAAGPPQQPICDPAVTAGQLSWGVSPALQKVVPFSLRHQILACPYSTGRALARSRGYGCVQARVPGEPLADLLLAARRYEKFLTPLGVLSPTFDVKPVCICRNQLRVPVRGLHIDTLASYYVVPSLGKEASGWWLLKSPRLTETARNGTNPKR
ncbi:hypothetical protein CSIM01_13770 [Colletotrichum simmondsii]|uniref:Uncharacterized protein n=1 Tax=Colletotrichum simmondsii TaxID=703756 RepID=A0A135TT48_9PEZI|nr:hypothetical protein CSIM01_13770 [Colletotrichum simmondsii]